MNRMLSAFIASTALLLASPVHADVINFEDLNAGGKLASIGKYNPYEGLTWSSSWFLGDASVAGYGNGAHSGTDFVTNGFGVNNLSINSAVPVDFNGAWFATPNTNGARASWINISAYDSANQLIGSTGNIAIGASYTFIAADFDNVARLNITRDKGWFVMDDISVGSPAAVPEPGSLALFALGVAALGWSGRRRAV